MMQKKLPANQKGKTIRLNKYLAQLGVASRRKIDELIERNQVWVNDRRASLGYKIDPSTDKIRVGKKEIRSAGREIAQEYWLVNKPVGVVSTTSDDLGRPTVVSLVKSSLRLFPVGRLDVESEGLILLTNDGELTQRLTHPRHHVPKVYRVWVRGNVTERDLDRIERGVKFKHERVAPAEVKVLEKTDMKAVLDLTLHQGVNRQVRRMMKALNLETVRLVRLSIGPLKLGKLAHGEARQLADQEVAALKDL
jgi:pseudouridine synthase